MVWQTEGKGRLLGACALVTALAACRPADDPGRRVVAEQDRGYGPAIAEIGLSRFIAEYGKTKDAPPYRLALLHLAHDDADFERRDLGPGLFPRLASTGVELAVAFADEGPPQRVRFMRLDAKGAKVAGSDRVLEPSDTTQSLETLTWNEPVGEWAVTFFVYSKTGTPSLHLARLDRGGELLSSRDLGLPCPSQASAVHWDTFGYVFLSACLGPATQGLRLCTVGDEVKCVVVDPDATGKPHLVRTGAGLLGVYGARHVVKDGSAGELRTTLVSKGQFGPPRVVASQRLDAQRLAAAGSTAEAAVLLTSSAGTSAPLSLLRLDAGGVPLQAAPVELVPSHPLLANADLTYGADHLSIVVTEGDLNAPHPLVLLTR